jgi:hypothetical protein
MNDGEWTGWLPTKSEWEKDYYGSFEARKALITLAGAGNDKSASAPPTEPVEEETKQFVEKAFTFPTAAGVPPKPNSEQGDWTTGPPKRLFLSIIPEYVPKTHGTFMVRATIEGTARGMVAESVDVVCAVHYVQSPSGLRYRLCTAAEALTVPSDWPLGAHAEEAGWLQVPRELTPVPGEESDRKTHLPVQVGTWPCLDRSVSG